MLKCLIVTRSSTKRLFFPRLLDFVASGDPFALWGLPDDRSWCSILGSTSVFFRTASGRPDVRLNI